MTSTWGRGCSPHCELESPGRAGNSSRVRASGEAPSWRSRRLLVLSFRAPRPSLPTRGAEAAGLLTWPISLRLPLNKASNGKDSG